MLINKSTYGDIYKREKCLLVASVHDLLAREIVLPGQMLLNVIYVLKKDFSYFDPSWSVQTNQCRFSSSDLMKSTN